MNNKSQCYYAFISYAREDLQDALYLKNFLEHFKVPLELVGPELRPEESPYLRRIFLDKSSLSCKTSREGRSADDVRTTWENELREKLANTRYLIVLCSPHSANKKTAQEKHYVDWEIQNFLSSHNGNLQLVIPVILAGEPVLNDTESCLPPSLRRPEVLENNLPNFRSESQKDQKRARENGNCMVVSRLLNLEREQVKDTLHEEKIRRWKLYGVIAAAVLFAFSGLTAWALYAEHRAEENRRLAEKNEKRAIAGEKLAKRNEFIAKENEKQAKENEGLAKRNEFIAKENEKKAEELRKKAEWDKQKLRNTLNFIQSIFNTASPFNPNDWETDKVATFQNTTILDAVKQNMSALQGIWPLEMKAENLADVTDIFRACGANSIAALFARQMVDAYRALAEEDRSKQKQLAHSLYVLADILSSNPSNRKEAEEIFQETLKIQRKLLKTREINHMDLISSLLYYSNLLYFNPIKRKETERIICELLEIIHPLSKNELNNRKSNNEYHSYTTMMISALSNYANFIEQEYNRRNEAERLYRNALKIAEIETKFHANKVLLFLPLKNYANFLAKDPSRREEAEKKYNMYLSFVLETSKKYHINFDYHLYSGLRDFANFLTEDPARSKEAETYFLKAIKIERRLSKKHQSFLVDLSETLNNYARLLSYNQIRSLEAEKYFQEALTIRRKYAKTDWVYRIRLAKTLNDFSRFLANNPERCVDAEKYCREALTIRRDFSRKAPQVYELSVAESVALLSHITASTSEKNQLRVEAFGIIAKYPDAPLVQKIKKILKKNIKK